MRDDKWCSRLMGISTIQNAGVDTNRAELSLVKAQLLCCLIDESTAEGEDFPMKEHLHCIQIFRLVTTSDQR